jgi:hypothetical protein
MRFSRRFVLPAAWMVATGVLSAAAIAAVGGRAVAPEIWFGLAAPLASAVVTWRLIERTQASAPDRLTGVLLAGFGGKAVLFGIYVVAALALLSLRPVPFMVSFTGYYIALHVGEALLLKRLLAGTAPPAAGAQSHPLHF